MACILFIIALETKTNNSKSKGYEASEII